MKQHTTSEHVDIALVDKFAEHLAEHVDVGLVDKYVEHLAEHVDVALVDKFAEHLAEHVDDALVDKFAERLAEHANAMVDNFFFRSTWQNTCIMHWFINIFGTLGRTCGYCIGS